MTPSNPEALPTDFLRGSVTTGHVVMDSVEKVIGFTSGFDPEPENQLSPINMSAVEDKSPNCGLGRSRSWPTAKTCRPQLANCEIFRVRSLGFYLQLRRQRDVVLGTCAVA